MISTDQPLHQCPIIPFSDKPIFDRKKKKKKKLGNFVFFYFSFYAREINLEPLLFFFFFSQVIELFHRSRKKIKNQVRYGIFM